MPRSLPGPVMGLPSTETSPVVGSSKPATIRSNVDLPQPEAPIRQTNCPAIDREIDARQRFDVARAHREALGHAAHSEQGFRVRHGAAGSSSGRGC